MASASSDWRKKRFADRLTALGDRVWAPTNRAAITTGHALTAATVVLNVEQILRDAGRALAHERLLCLGLGSIGLSSLRLLLQVAPHPHTIMLCDLAAKVPQLQAIGTELVEQYGFQGDVQIIPVQQTLPPAVYTATSSLEPPTCPMCWMWTGCSPVPCWSITLVPTVLMRNGPLPASSASTICS